MSQSLRVLIADDEPIARLDLREMLQALGHEVIAELSDGDAALESSRTLKPHVAILDIRMPGLDGLEVARLLAEESVCPSLIVSAFSDEQYIERSKETGCLYYLVKPIRQSDLGPALAMTMALANRLESLQKELEAVQDALETRKSVERAKGVLMETEGITEREAFRKLQLESMNSRRSMREVADSVISSNTP